MKKFLPLVLALLCALHFHATGADAPAPQPLQFPSNGFSIAPLEGTSNTDSYQVLHMLMPAADGFAPNVNVMVQPYTGTIKEYVDLSKDQFKQANFTIVSVASKEDSCALDYSGTLQERKLHFYARAIRRGGKIYLATGTALEQQWPAIADKLKACVDSFQLQ